MFKLLEIEFIDHPFFRSLPVRFVGHGEEQASNYTTLIIGPNGTGKSKLLLATIEIFNSLESVKRSGKNYSFKTKYRLKFTNRGREHKVDYTTGDLLINDNDYRKVIDNVDLPTKLLISAFSFNDKYPLREQRGKVVNPQYHYLGLKSTTNSLFVGNPTKTAISNLCEAVISKKDIAPLKDAFTTLDLRPTITLLYKPGRNFKFLLNNEFWDNRNQTPSQFVSSFTSFLKMNKRKNAKPMLRRLGNEKIERLLDDASKIRSLTSYLNENIRIITDLSRNAISLRPVLNLERDSSFDVFVKHVLALQVLSDLEVVSLDRLEVQKLNAEFSFDDSSSGEYHIILTYLNILSLLEDNSLVLLDEPEISLHPNWQIRYMDIFSRVFAHYPNTHFIIASHSHFLVSDLEQSKSHILGFAVDDSGMISVTQTEKNTYGWSAEQVLLDIFRVASTRNYFITRTVTDVLKELSKEQPNYGVVKSKLQQVIFLDINDFKDHDPMKEIFAELTKLYNDL